MIFYLFRFRPVFEVFEPMAVVKKFKKKKGRKQTFKMK